MVVKKYLQQLLNFNQILIYLMVKTLPIEDHHIQELVNKNAITSKLTKCKQTKNIVPPSLLDPLSLK